MKLGKKCQIRKPGLEHNPNPGFQVRKTAGFLGYPGSGKPGFMTLIILCFAVITHRCILSENAFNNML